MSHPLALLVTKTAVAIPEDLARAVRIYRYQIETRAERSADFVPDPEFHPDAARLVAEIRASMQPTTLKIVLDWLRDLTPGPSMSKTPGVSLAERAGALFSACREFPASVWNVETLAMAIRTFRWFPSAAEVYDLLKPEVDKLMGTIEGLEAIAKAPPAMRAVPAREPYVPPPIPEWVFDRRIRGSSGRPDLKIQPPLRTVAEQIALLKAG